MTTTTSGTFAPASLAAWERCKRSVGGGVSSGLRAGQQPHPIFIGRASGALLWDIDGREYVDYVGAWGPMILGHSHPGVLAAVAEVLPQMQLVGMGHALEYEAAEAVLDVVPGAERMLWSNTGTEVVQIALRLARARSRRNRFVKFVGGYHGWHDSVLASVAFHEPGERATAQSLGQNMRLLDDIVVLPFNDVEAVRRTLGGAAANDIGAVLLDPILSSGGLEEPSPDFLDAVRAGCDANGVVLIFDEVISGFRVALGGAAERWGVTPDLWTFGKAMAGGMSQAAVAGRGDIIDLVNVGVAHAGTYNGNPLALAGVKATIQALSEPGVYERLDAASDRLLAGLIAIADEAGAPIEAHRVASMISIHPSGGDETYGDRVVAELAREGVLFVPFGKVFVSLAHTDSIIDRSLEAFRRALSQVA